MLGKARLAMAAVIAAFVLGGGNVASAAEPGSCQVTNIVCILTQLGVPNGGRCSAGVHLNCSYCSFNGGPTPHPDQFCDDGYPGWQYRNCGLWLSAYCV